MPSEIVLLLGGEFQHAPDFEVAALVYARLLERVNYPLSLSRDVLVLMVVERSAMPALSPRQWNVVLITVLVAGSLFIAATRVQPSSGAHSPAAQTDVLPDPAPLPDHPAPDLALPQLDGTSLTLHDLRGQVVLINVWATWCPPCRAEMPAIQQAYAEYHDRGFTVLAVNQREDASAITPFLEQHGLTFPILLDGDGQASAAYQASALPSSFFVDRHGVIRAVYRGPMPSRVIAGTVEQLLQERP